MYQNARAVRAKLLFFVIKYAFSFSLLTLLKVPNTNYRHLASSITSWGTEFQNKLRAASLEK